MLTPLASSAAANRFQLSQVSLLRLDQQSNLAPGNKRYKLQGYVDHAKANDCTTLVSFGGAWSNHLHALAAVGKQEGLATVGIVRCEEHEAISPTLEDARSWGMQVVPVGRAQYKLRHLEAYQQDLQRRYSPCVVIPEGGASGLGALGCRDIAAQILKEQSGARRIVLPVGTGTTLAGVVAALPADYEVIGISALKGAKDIEQTVMDLLRQMNAESPAAWQVLHDFHCGGFAKANDDLKQFMHAFERDHGVLLDPVYTAKMLLAIHQLRQSRHWDKRAPVIAIHTGGVQGRRGFSWLEK